MVKKLIRQGKSQDWDVCLNELLSNDEFMDFVKAVGYV